MGTCIPWMNMIYASHRSVFLSLVHLIWYPSYVIISHQILYLLHVLFIIKDISELASNNYPGNISSFKDSAHFCWPFAHLSKSRVFELNQYRIYLDLFIFTNILISHHFSYMACNYSLVCWYTNIGSAWDWSTYIPCIFTRLVPKIGLSLSIHIVSCLIVCVRYSD